MKRENLKVEKRTISGKQVRKLRRDGILPGNIYGKDIKSQMVQLPVKEFKKVFNEVHETGLVDLAFDGQTIPVLIHNVQIEPKSRDTLHADFFKVNLKEKIVAKIPVVAVGEPQAVTNKIGLLLHLINELEIEALPTDLPEKIEVNVESLSEVDQSILVSNISLPTGVTMITDGDQTVFKIGELVTKEAEAEAAAEEAAAEVAAAETAGEGAEGGEAKEGEEKPDEGEKTEETSEKPKEEPSKGE
ncbi:MAG: 50S ribosomal protein L25 [Candidatus Levybacteria bacterium CG_4_10_14_0_2_um_filter_36_16]|nr:MAG: hypothetical protein AUK12_04995 [Candidatus Levybacteria bacterium CG2_30_37_29]PIZ97301.1 MAG: 50S ribosomal protein L25 [Candidatus Levybacteria bacterium CG_4_10_14_0_2_um_filter_36_16]